MIRVRIVLDWLGLGQRSWCRKDYLRTILVFNVGVSVPLEGRTRGTVYGTWKGAVVKY